MRLSPAVLLAAILALPAVFIGTARAQVTSAQTTSVKDASALRPPAGAKVAIVDFEDLECPACSHAFPMVHEAVDRYKIPLVRHDFPLQMHIWSRDAAVIARYIQDKISPKAAEDYRGAVFASQMSISSKDDLQAFTQRYFQQHGRTMPFVVDPTGEFAKEVQADYDLGVRVGLNHTPSIFIVSNKGYTEVTDLSQLYQTIDAQMAANPGSSSTPSKSANSKLRHPTTPQR